MKGLNQTQQRAVLKVLSTSDYLLVQSTSGADRTQTIVAIVRLLVALHKTVLIASYSNFAVDNVLIELKQQAPDVPFLRLGDKSRIHQDLHPHAVETFIGQLSTSNSLAQFYEQQQVVATTCLGIYSHPLFEVRKAFDYCILDDASQILLPSCLGPLFYANKFILFGDSKQPPSVIKSSAARELGVGESLFKTLHNDHNTVEITSTECVTITP